MLRHGCLVIGGLGVSSASELALLRACLGRGPAASREPFAARQDFGDGVYSWPDWSPAREMCPHHEQSYTIDYPGLLLMACLGVPAQGGAIQLADTRRFLSGLPAGLSGRLAAEGWLFRRTFLPRLGVGWQEALGVSDPHEVGQVCAERDLECEWSADDTLRVRQRRAAVITHPVTGEKCAFNDLLFMSHWSVPKAERDVLLSAFGSDGLPFNGCYGSGEALSQDDYWAMTRAYQQVTVRLAWQRGDLLLIDNVLTAHGREPYAGTWPILTALADPARS